MKPSIAIDITARDKTAAGRKQAEGGFRDWSKRVSSIADNSGLSRLGKQLEGLTKFSRAPGLADTGRALTVIGTSVRAVGGDLAAATSRALGFGVAAEGALVGVAGVATSVATGIGAVAAAIGLADAAAVLLAAKWAKVGAEVGRTSKTIGVTAGELQAARAAGERFGVTADATTASLDSLGSTLYDAKYGANNLALGALNQLGIKLQQTKDGAVDVNQAMLDIADAIARQKNPQVQKKLAGIFGLSAMLPALRQGSAALKREGGDYLRSLTALSDDEVARSERLYRKNVTAIQHGQGALPTGARAGMAAETIAEPQLDWALRQTPKVEAGIRDAGTKFKEGVKAVERGARDLADHVGRAIASGIGTSDFDAFAARIERQESGGRQLDSRGRPLKSSVGAVGVMQMLPETARAAARHIGVPWDQQRFERDPDYNRMLGRAELRRLLDKYDGHEALAAAAYNAGEGRLDRDYLDKNGTRHSGWLARFGDPRKGEISDQEFAARIPFPETRQYVANTANKTQVEITLKGAPAGTVARVAPSPFADVEMRIQRSLDGP